LSEPQLEYAQISLLGSIEVYTERRGGIDNNLRSKMPTIERIAGISLTAQAPTVTKVVVDDVVGAPDDPFDGDTAAGVLLAALICLWIALRRRHPELRDAVN
jgi:hypothetical protein